MGLWIHRRWNGYCVRCMPTLNTVLDVAGYIWHETFSLWCHFLQCPFKMGSAWAERAGLGELGVTVRLKSRRENKPFNDNQGHSTAEFRHSHAFFFTLHQRIEKTVLSPRGAHVEPFSQSGWVVASWKPIANLLMGGCGLSHECVEDDCYGGYLCEVLGLKTWDNSCIHRP